MSQHGIETIKIENFKCFENLEINGFKRVNLIGGKNNVGKTVLLEALELAANSYDPYTLAYIMWLLLRRRQDSSNLENDLFFETTDIIQIITNTQFLKIEKSTDLSQLSIFEDRASFSIKFTANGVDFILPIERLTDYRLNSSISIRADKDNLKGIFVKSSELTDDDLAILYGAIINKDKEDFLEKSLHDFSNNILSLKIVPMKRGVKLKAKLADRKELVLLSSLGEGVNRYIAILCAIWASQDGYLFIDEIENGIHYTNYPKLWELIFVASAQANCQVFVTSHSKECITAFNNTQLLENTKNSGAYFELFYSQKKQRISAAYRDAEQLKYALDHNEDIRGE